jgi:hypothetical protein
MLHGCQKLNLTFNNVTFDHNNQVLLLKKAKTYLHNLFLIYM